MNKRSAGDSGGKPVCKYGEKCYRKNPDHLRDFHHPTKEEPSSKKAKKDDDEEKEREEKERKEREEKDKEDKKVHKDDLPACPYGATCYRKNVLHFAEYSHPTRTAGHQALVKGKLKAEDDSKGDEDGDGGPKLKRSYSQMSEDERKKLIDEAMNLKKLLKEKEDEAKKKDEELAKVKVEMSEKLKNLKSQLDSGHNQLLPGEEEAMENNKFTIFKLTISRLSTFGDIAEFHYRYAESQFLRLCAGAAYHVIRVDYVVAPPLVRKFEKKQEQFRSEGKDTSHILGFHGTSDEAIDAIVKNNFDVGRLGGYTGDKGYYGAGIYFSEYTSTSLGYNRSSRMLLSKVLIGKQFQCPGLMMGAPLKKGYDSHLSPCGHEVVIYDADQILPCYIVHFESGTATIDIKDSTLVSDKLVTTDVPDSEKVSKKAPKKVKAEKKKKEKAPKKKGKKKKAQVFEGLTFCVSGKFDSYTQAQMKDLLSQHGADIASSVTLNVTHVAAANLGTSKADKAVQLGVPVVSQDWILQSIEDGELSTENLLFDPEN